MTGKAGQAGLAAAEPGRYKNATAMRKPVPLRPDDPCPRCGKPLRCIMARSPLTLFFACAWLCCSGAPQCGFARLYR
jgi:hypothetical protein